MKDAMRLQKILFGTLVGVAGLYAQPRLPIFRASIIR